MLLDSGFHCEGLGSDFLLQSRECDLMHNLKCLMSVPLSALPTTSNSSNITIEMESAKINK